MTQQTALAQRTSTPQSLALVTTSQPGKMTLAELKEIAAIYVESGSFPDLKNVAQAIVKIKAGEDLGFSPHVAIAGIHFFQGRAVIGANLLASLIKSSGKYEYKVLEHDKKRCSLQMMQLFNGKWAAMGVPVTYTIEDATLAGLTSKEVWKKFPADMLFAACIRQATRRYCADVLRGTPTFDHYSDEEAEIDSSRVVETPPPVEQSPDIVDQVEDAESSDLGEAVTDAEFDDPQNAVEAKQADFITVIKDLLGEKTGGDVAEIKKILKGRDLHMMTLDALAKLHDELIAL